MVKIFAITANGKSVMSEQEIADAVRDSFKSRGFAVGEFEVEHVDSNGFFGHVPVDGAGVQGLATSVREDDGPPNKPCFDDQNVKVYIHSYEDAEEGFDIGGQA
jgi:hypothetical protein